MTTPRVYDVTRQDTWDIMVELDQQVRYYLRLADRHMLRYRSIRLLLLFGILAEGAAVYFLAEAPPALLWGIAGTGAFLIGLVTMFDPYTNYAERAANLRAAHLMCDDLKIDAERLWRDIEADRIQDQEAGDRYSEITKQRQRAVSMAGTHSHRRDNLRSAKEASRAITARYAPQGDGHR